MCLLGRLCCRLEQEFSRGLSARVPIARRGNEDLCPSVVDRTGKSEYNSRQGHAIAQFLLPALIRRFFGVTLECFDFCRAQRGMKKPRGGRNVVVVSISALCRYLRIF